MNSMEKIPGIVLDIVFAFFGISNLLTIGADYRHVFAGLSGSLFVTTFLNKTKKDKLWFALGGFSFACFVGPAICEYFNCGSQSSMCIAIYFGSGTLGMLLVQLLVTILNETKTNIPSLVKVSFNAASLFVKKWFNSNNQNPNNNV